MTAPRRSMSARRGPSVPGLLAPTLLLSALSGSAWAGQVLVPPLVPAGVDPIVAGNISGMIASELDFISEFDGAKAVKTSPAGWNAKCITSAPCVTAVMKATGTTALISGSVAPNGSKLALTLVYANGGKIVRTKTFNVANVPSVIADSMAGFVKELISGENPAAVAAAARVDEGNFSDDEDDFEVVGVSRRVQTGGTTARGLEDEVDEDELAAQEAERERAAAAAAASAAAAKREKEEAARRQAEAQRQEEERARVAAAQRQREEEEQRRQAAAAAAARSKPPPAEEEEELVFGGGVVSTGGGEEEPPPRPVAAARPTYEDVAEDEDEPSPTIAAARAPSRTTYSDLDEDEDPPLRKPAPVTRYDDLDEPVSKPRSSSSSNSSANRSSSSSSANSRSTATKKKGEPERSVGITGRFGYSKLAEYNFLTYGAEVTVMPTSSLGILAGIEAYSARRATTAEEQELGAPPLIWQTIMPINVGAVYKYTPTNVRPYVGGDIHMIPGLVRDQGGLATGFRFRGGSDFLVTDSFGFNLNLALGFTGGKALSAVTAGTSAIIPQFSAGTTLVF